jgi:hypothetical protein
MARPPINALESGAAPELAETTTNRRMAKGKTVLMLQMT